MKGEAIAGCRDSWMPGQLDARTAGCRDKKLSEMIHMMALSTVIGRLIFSLYPECNKNTRPLCRKDILPRDYGTK